MKKLVIFTLVLSMLVSGIDCAAQFRYFKKAYQAATSKVAPIITKAGRAVHDYRVPSRTDLTRQYDRLNLTGWENSDSHLKSKFTLKKPQLPIFPNLKDLRRHRQEARLQQAKEELQKEYQELCVEIVQGMLSDTLALVRIGNKAMKLKCNSIAVTCFTQFISCRPSTLKIVTAVDSLMDYSQSIAPIIIDEDIEYKFCKYWESPDSIKMGISDFEILAELGNKYSIDCRKTELAQGMLQYFDCNYDNASKWFEYATRKVLMQSEKYDIVDDNLDDGLNMDSWNDETVFTQSGKFYLFSVTALCMDRAQRYSDMLTLFGGEAIDKYMAKIPYMTFLLYKAALFADPSKTEKYWDMGVAANEEYFMEQFRELYNGIYTDFLENPQPLTNLDFLTAALDSNNLSSSYIDMTCKLLEKLPDMPDDGMEHYYDDALIPYREALLEIANRSDSLHLGQLTPDNASVKIIAESTRSSFLSSVEQGRANLKVLHEQLYKKRKTPEYDLVIVTSGACYSIELSYQRPKEALKVMKRVLPIIKKLDAEDENPLGTEYTAELYKYMADLYHKNNKPKEAEKMHKLADECITVVE